tara:strand:+ start:1259 stop:1399 length:141 start_codon:yes stop_codon:yes gene_type:complete
MINIIFIGIAIFILANILGIFIVLANSWNDTENNIKEDIIKCKWTR